MELKIKGLRPVHVESLREASERFRETIERLDLGASEVGSAKVYVNGANGFKQIAAISYNGRVWDMDNKEIK